MHYGFAQNAINPPLLKTIQKKTGTANLYPHHTREKVSMTSGGISKFFNIQNQKSYVISCSECSFSEFYRADVKAWENIVDSFGN